MNGSHLCALDDAGAVHCQRWESNAAPDQSVPVTGLPPMSAISGGHTVSTAASRRWMPRHGAGHRAGPDRKSPRRYSSRASARAARDMRAHHAGIALVLGTVPGAAAPVGIHFVISASGLLGLRDRGASPPLLLGYIGSHAGTDEWRCRGSVAMGHSRSIYNGPSGATGFYALPYEQTQIHTIATLPSPRDRFPQATIPRAPLRMTLPSTALAARTK